MRGDGLLARGSSRRRRLKLVLAILAGSALVVAAAEALDLRVNWTDSMPLGLYRRVPPTFARNEWVGVCLEGQAAEIARRRGYVIHGSCPSGLVQIMKRIAGVPGDRVAITPRGVRINGRPVPGSTLKDRDSRGRPLAHLPEGAFVLPAGRYFVMGVHVGRSWDSRYFGPVAREQIVGGAEPLVTF